jgi:hypothetical protein
MMIEMNRRNAIIHATAVVAASTQPNVEIDKEELYKKLDIKVGDL